MLIPRPEELERELIEMGDTDFGAAIEALLGAVAVACRHHGIVSTTHSESVAGAGFRFQLMQDGKPVRSCKALRARYRLEP